MGELTANAGRLQRGSIVQIRLDSARPGYRAIDGVSAWNTDPAEHQFKTTQRNTEGAEGAARCILW